ncbi:sulfatase [Nocardioides sp.]|uniref:sulfatase family protein n=1 Tax=Nocardioides sp. TaxID=35761 RepID=UPI002C2202C8|nr:sulfatase [Nocardioides sp.]HSX67217.1 sulfatase [Nocardioides sp.]
MFARLHARREGRLPRWRTTTAVMTTLALTAGVAALTVHEAATVPAEAATRPNVLVIMTDDMRADELRFMPNVRRYVQQRGLTWRNAYATTPLCCPDRASFLTGRFTHNHKVWWHDAPYGYGAFNDSRTLATALRGVGMRTGYVGKYLNRYGLAKPKTDPTARPATFVPAGWHQWRGTPDGTGLAESDPRAGGTYRYFDTTVNVNGSLQGHAGTYSSRVMADESLKVLDRFTSLSAPWFLYVNSLAPHVGGPWEPGDPGLKTPARPDWVKGRFDDQIRRGRGVPASGEPEPDVSDKPSMIRNLPRLDDADRRAVLKLTRQRAEALYALDVQLGRMFRMLANRGELGRTRIVFTSDNGYFLGEHRRLDGKNSPYEPSYKVPLLMAGPGIPEGSRVAPATTVDLSATVAEWAGTRLPYADGRSLAADIATSRGWTRVTMFEAGNGSSTLVNEAFGRGRAVMGIRTARYAFFRYARGAVELYDMVKDPNQLRNVAGSTAYADVRRQLNAVLTQVKDCAGATCRVDLPVALQVSESATRSITNAAADAKKAYYGS